MDHFQPAAVYVGNNRVLTRSNILDLIYFVPADDRLLAPRFIMHGVLESETTNYFLRAIRPESVCLDIGANFGYYTCLMARLALKGRVIGIEADPQIFNLARDNIHINWLERHARLMNAAVADREGTLTLHRRLTRSGNTSIIKFDDKSLASWGEGPSEAFDIRSITLNHIDAEIGKVDFVKIDVEGAEPLVFRGAHEFISSNPAVRIVMEWSPLQIKEAGFDVSVFCNDLAGLGLRPALLLENGDEAECSWERVRQIELANLLLKL